MKFAQTLTLNRFGAISHNLNNNKGTIIHLSPSLQQPLNSEQILVQKSQM